nr:hypothetical protein [Tanacetum cinerariifolium]
MSTPKFADVYNLVAFLSKPTKSEGFEQIIDFLNANPIKYSLTLNPTIYTSCIEQFWVTANAKNINGEAQIHAKVDGKKVIISEATIRKYIKFEDEEGVDCLSNEVILEQLPLMWFVQVFLDKQVDGMSKHNAIYVIPSHTKKVVADKDVYEEMYDSVERAATTTIGLNAEHDRGIISKTQFMATLNEPSSIGTSSGSGPRHQETMRMLLLKLGSQEAGKEKEVKISLVEKVSTATTTTAKDLTVNDINLAKALEALKTSKPKIRGIVVRDHEEPSKSKTTTTPTSVADSTRLKVKGIVMQEPSKATTTTILIPTQVKDKRKEYKVVKDRAEGSKIRSEESSKRTGEDLQQESTKKHKTMFKHHVEDSVWKNQQGLAKVKNWKLFDS